VIESVEVLNGDAVTVTLVVFFCSFLRWVSLIFCFNLFECGSKFACQCVILLGNCLCKSIAIKLKDFVLSNYVSLSIV
jgi:hypothetical protein